jgi:hypothetical protein
MLGTVVIWVKNYAPAGKEYTAGKSYAHATQSGLALVATLWFHFALSATLWFQRAKRSGLTALKINSLRPSYSQFVVPAAAKFWFQSQFGVS